MLVPNHSTPNSAKPDMMRPFLPLLILATLTGCATSVKQLHELNPAADNFTSALASEYRDYADSEYEQGRSMAAEHFAAKGLKSLKGEEVLPEAVDTSLHDDQQLALSDGRATLVKLLNDDVKRVAPQKLARTQLLYECWQNELIKNINQEKAPCADEFRSTIAELQEVSDAIVYGKETSHVIVFEPKKTDIDEEGLKTIKAIAQRVEGLPHYRVMVLAYTGNGIKQRHLTGKRVGNVRKALIAAGISEKHIRVKKSGGAKAVILSRDNIAADGKKITILVKTHDTTKER